MEKFPLMRCASFRGYRELVDTLGGDPDQYLAQAGLGGLKIENDALLVPTHCLCNALEIASQELGVADFGLQLSLHHDLDILGPIAILIQNAASLSDILGIVTRHVHRIHNQSDHTVWYVKDNLIYLQHVQVIPNAISDLQITLLQAGFTARMLQHRLEPGLIANAVYFKHAKPKDIQLYRDIFKTDIYFNQPFIGAVGNVDIFQKNYTVKKVNVSNVESMLLTNEDHTTSISQQLRILISQTSFTDEKGLPFYADLLQIGERTLQRKLSSEGQSFTRIVDQIRKEAAKQYIDDQFYNMVQISEILGFADPAVFTRAFKRWYKITPKRYSTLIKKQTS